MKTKQKSTPPLAKQQTLSLTPVHLNQFSLVSRPGLTHHSIHFPREDKQTKKRYKASVCVQENKSSKSAGPQGTRDPPSPANVNQPCFCVCVCVCVCVSWANDFPARPPTPAPHDPLS